MAAFWFTGVALFVMELGVALDYVQARVSALTQSAFGFFPAMGFAAWNAVESAFWNFGHLEAAFRVIPFIVIPFLLVGLGLSMKEKFVWQREQRTAE